MTGYEITTHRTGWDKFGRPTESAILTFNGERVCVLEAEPEYTDNEGHTTYKHVGRGWTVNADETPWNTTYAPSIASGSAIGTFSQVPTDEEIVVRSLELRERLG